MNTLGPLPAALAACRTSARMLYSSARASRDKARAALDSAKKALDDTVLKARFSGVVSDTYADNFDTVAAGTPILKLQDLTAFDLAVSVPESYVLSATADVRSHYTFEASFDSLPGRTFPVAVKDAARIADPVTQTYRATFTLEAPEGLVILPGMTCTVTSTVTEEDLAATAGDKLAVPSNAVGAAADATSFVWRLDDNGDGTFTARRATVKLGQRTGESIYVLSGLSAGERIAVAGVTVLTEGRIVRLTDEAAAK
jgi:RND family efflux transporter MFP subunit